MANQPTDKSYFILPDLGEGVHEAELIKWRVKPGEPVEEHQTLAEMETDKALVEVPSPWAGVVSELHGDEGEILIVGNKLVSYATSPGSAAAPPAAAKTASAGATDNGEREDAGTVVGTMDTTLTVPDRFARREPVAVTAEPVGKALATPAVRRIARQLGVDIDRVPGSGRGGRVTASDVESFVQGTAAPAVATAPSPTPAPLAIPAAREGVDNRIPFRGVRRKIAEALRRSVSTTVHFTVVDEADITALDGKRREYSAVIGRKLSFLPFVMTAVCQALRRHPALNANVDDEKGEIIERGSIHLGIAVDTDHGLMVPVIPDADHLSLVQLSDGVTEVASGCRNRTIERERLLGGTFTISNVGSYGGMFATPIINYPEVAILAVGRAYEKVLVQDGKIYAGRVLPLSLSCDHRVVDGAEGARFLNTVRTLLESATDLVGG